MDEFEKIRAFSAELGKKTEEAVAAENEGTSLKKEEAVSSVEKAESADFLESWVRPSETQEEVRSLSRTFWLVLGVVSILAIALVVVLYFLFKTPMENEEIVTIAPTQKPVKVRPENPGGLQIPDQDKVIYSRISQDAIPAKVEKLFPDEEKPVMPVVVSDVPDVQEPEVIEKVEVKVVQASEPLEIKEELSPIKAEEIVLPKQEKVETKVPEKVKIEAPKGEWKVQLFSSADKAKVEKQWQVISQKQKALVSDMPMQIVPAQIAGKGTFYRLQVGAFETREMAANLCAKLKKQKQDCIPAK